MPHSRISGDEIVERGEALYEQTIRFKVETEENIGKMVSIDIESGAFAVDTNLIVSGLPLQSINPDAAIHGKRIGYDSAFAIVGTRSRIVR